jgi:hypothetical protein
MMTTALQRIGVFVACSMLYKYPISHAFTATLTPSNNNVPKIRSQSASSTGTSSSSALFAEMMTIQRGCQFYCLQYNYIVQPDNDTNLAPIVVLQGGSLSESTMMMMMMMHEGIPNRSVLVYDPLGCGKSDQPDYNESLYSISLFVDDLVQLLNELKMDTFHLYLQRHPQESSLEGSILALEYLKRERPDGCLSVTLSSIMPTQTPTPTSVSSSSQQVQESESEAKDRLAEVFRDYSPAKLELELLDPDEDEAVLDVPALLVISSLQDGERRDAVTPNGILLEGWEDHFENSRVVEVEEPGLSLETLDSFWKEHETQGAA